MSTSGQYTYDINDGTYTAGSLNILNGSSMSGYGNLHVGEFGNGTLLISGNSTASGKYAAVGDQSGGVGAATVTGASSAWNNLADVTVGYSGNGTLTIANGGTVTAGSGVTYTNNSVTTVSSSTVFVATQPGSVGVVNIGAAAGSAPVAPGTVGANTVAFGAGSGSLVLNHTSLGYDFSSAIKGNGTISLLAGTTIFTGNLSGFTGHFIVDPSSGVVTGYTTPAAQQSSVETMGRQQQATAIQSRATANALLGMTRPVDAQSYVFGDALVGSAVGMAGGQMSGHGVTLLGGIAYGAQDYPGLRQSDAPTIAAALRYTFNTSLSAHALYPFSEIGGWVSPRETLTFDRTYQNGSNAATGEGSTNATAWDEYVRAGMIWDINKANRLVGFGEVGQQNMAFSGYSETLSQNDPFPATLSSGVMRFDVVRAGGMWTSNLYRLIYAPWTISVAGAVAHSVNTKSGVTVNEAGLSNMSPENNDVTWEEFGARLDTALTKRVTASIGVNGTTGPRPIGTTVHGEAGLSYKF